MACLASDLIYPYEKQIITVQLSDAKINIYTGAVRSGKTVAQMLALVRMLMHAPPGVVVLVAYNLSNVHRNIIGNLRALLGQSIVPIFDEKRSHVTLLGRECFCYGANNMRSSASLRGLNIVGMIIDEATTMPEDMFNWSISRLNTPGAIMVATTNPDSPFHFLKTDFIDKGERAHTKSFHFSIDDNESLTPEYKSLLASTLKGVYYKRYYLGEWAIADDLVYGFLEDKHFDYYTQNCPQKWICGVDFGMRHKTAAVLVGIDHNSPTPVWVQDEFEWEISKDAEGTSLEIALQISEWLSSFPVESIYVDPSALVFRQDLRRAIPGGLVCEAKNDVLNGIACVSTMMAKGHLKIGEKCTKLKKEMFTYSWDTGRSKRCGKDCVAKVNDDMVDALRYAIYSHFGDETSVQQNVVPPIPPTLPWTGKARIPAYKQNNNLFF